MLSGQLLPLARGGADLQTAQRRAMFVSEASSLLASSLDYETTLERVARLAVPAFAGTCVVHLLDDDEVRRVIIASADPAREERLHEYNRRWPSGLLNRSIALAGRTLFRGEVTPEVMESLAEDAEHLAGLRALATRSFVVVPLVARERTLGTVTFAVYGDASPYTEADVALAEDLARRIAIALDNARLYQQAHEAEDRAAFLAEASHVLASSLECPPTLRSVATLAVPRLADWCIVDLLEDDGTVRRTAVVHRDPLHAELAAEMERRPPSAVTAPSVLHRVLRTGRAAFFPRVAASDMVTTRTDEFRIQLLRRVNPVSVMIVPLQGRGRVLGALTLMMADSRRRYRQVDLALAENLAARAVLAVDNAALYREAREAERRAAFLAEASRLLASSLEYETTFEAVADLVVRQLADWCIIDGVGLDRRLARLAVAHSDPGAAATADAVRRLPLAPGFFASVPEFLRRGNSLLAAHLPPEAVRVWAQSEAHLAVLQAVAPRSAVCAPLVVRDRVLGALTVYARSEGRYAERDLALCEELARRLGLALDQGRLHRKVQAARAQADDANRLKDEFLATLSHELRSPLSAVLTWSHLLRRGFLDEARTARALETIEQNARHQVRLIEDLLDVSRIVAGKLTLQTARVDVEAVLDAAVEAARAAADAKGVALEITTVAARPVLADPTRLQQVFANLLSNAIKFTPSGGRVSVALVPAGERGAAVTVADTGIGISADVLPHIFDRFRQADSSTTRRFGGLGIGLAIARHLVELHGGTITAESPGEDRGATFRVVLPGASAEQPAAADAPLVLDPHILAGLRVVVVDDHADARDFLTIVLGRYGADVTPATSAADAFEAIAGVGPDVLVADVAMPEEDGYALVRRLRQLQAGSGRTTRALAVTALASSEDRERSLQAGFDVHLTKPVDPLHLVSAVARAVAR